ncbi:hypothetical protein [Schleiferilactobacillus shenzhenensis]|uniref:Uncharacterized protein n=1 Tax=Schleiferilactobacillus shenzhenensis LY-73 TaxID=1231336 RepID=U4TQV8_9LACO|nr:hypothetical protein [Schleiferilactobacillus shenzhenensis]ERL63887.1 hypothetical protein L248_1828 [Schleiferilactobacillus shenzhenensis LY-73]
MKILIKPIGGQSPISWLLQIGLLALIWAVYKKTLPRDTTTILIAGALIIAIYLSFAVTKKFAERDSGDSAARR